MFANAGPFREYKFRSLFDSDIGRRSPEMIISKVRDFGSCAFLVAGAMSEIIDCVVLGSCRFKKRGKNETPRGVSFLLRFLKV